MANVNNDTGAMIACKVEIAAKLGTLRALVKTATDIATMNDLNAELGKLIDRLRRQNERGE